MCSSDLAHLGRAYSGWVSAASAEGCLNMSRDPDEALDVLRGVWSAQGQTSADLDAQLAGGHKACKRMADVGFGGLTGDDEDLRTAWRNRLEREGKLNPSGGSVADLVFGSTAAAPADPAPADPAPAGPAPADRTPADPAPAECA